MMASNKVKLRNLSKGTKGAKRALKLLQRPDILLSSILIGNNIAKSVGSAIVTIMMIEYLKPCSLEEEFLTIKIIK